MEERVTEHFKYINYIKSKAISSKLAMKPNRFQLVFVDIHYLWKALQIYRQDRHHQKH